MLFTGATQMLTSVTPAYWHDSVPIHHNLVMEFSGIVTIGMRDGAEKCTVEEECFCPESCLIRQLKGLFFVFSKVAGVSDLAKFS